MGLEKLIIENKIPIAPENDKHSRPGWLNIACPFCGEHKSNYHLGLHLKGQYFNCFACGKKDAVKTLIRLLHISENEAIFLYKTHKSKSITKTFKREKEIENKEKFELPPNTKPLNELPAHQKYLKSRGFDWQFLEDNFKICGTTHSSLFKGIDLSWRLVIPIFSKDKIVSWQTRTIATKNKAKLPYISCPKNVEVIPHKNLLYPYMNEIYVFLTEGIMDCWKILMAGFPSVCTFGTEITPAQIKLLTKKIIYIFADGDTPGIKAANKLKHRIEFISGVNVTIINSPWGKDPGDLTVKEIQKLLKNFKF